MSFLLAIGAFLFIVLLGMLLLALLGWRHPSMTRHYVAPLVFLVVILFLAGWSGLLWLRPIATPLGGEMTVIPFVIVACISALLIAATGPALRHPPSREAPVQQQDVIPRRSHALLFGAVFWTLLAVLAVVIVAGYLVARVVSQST